MKNLILSFLILFFLQTPFAQGLEAVPFDKEWKDKLTNYLPEQALVKPDKKRKILLFDLTTGYNHWVIPHTSYMIEQLGKKSKAFSVKKSKDISAFEEKSLKKYDAVIINNTCSKREKRDLFWDVLKENPSLTEEEKINKAQQLEDNLLNFVKDGGGLAVFHGALTILNYSEQFSDLVGASFDYHPPQQEVVVEIVEEDHPMTSHFESNAFTHIDEPYFFNGAYADLNFKPLLSMDASLIENQREPAAENTRYLAWIKSYGKGKVFYTSPSHNAQSFENTDLLQFYLNGIQYTTGDLVCDDTP